MENKFELLLMEIDIAELFIEKDKNPSDGLAIGYMLNNNEA